MVKEKLELIPLINDYMFKKVFIENPNILKKMLISVLKLNMNPSLSELVFLNSELPKTKKKEYRKTVDILVTINKEKVIDVEINTESYHYIAERNTFYMEKIISMGVEEGTSYNKMKNYYFYQLNLNVYGRDNYFKDKYFTLREEKTNEILTPNIEIIYKSLDYYYDIYYNKGEIIEEDALWLILIRSKSFKELEMISRKLMNEEEYRKFMKSVRDGCMDGFSLANWESDKMEYLVRSKAEEYKKREEEARKKEDEKRKREDEKRKIEDEKRKHEDEKRKIEDKKIKLAQEKLDKEIKAFEQEKKNELNKNISIVKKLLQRNFTYEEISEITEITIEKIKEIEAE